MANGASHPATEWFVHNARRKGFDVPLDLAPVEEVAERLQYIAKREGKPLGDIVEYDAFHYEHQMPGGMISNLKSQLTQLGIARRLPEVLEEAARVRCELGYPIIVSPFAQFVMTQAVLNVMGKERYGTVPDEVRKYVLGYYGEIAGPIDSNLFDRITRGAEPTTARPGDLLEPALPRIRRERGPFASDDDLLLAAYYSDQEYKALKAAGPINTEYPLASTPLATLLKEVAQRRDIRSFHFVTSQGSA
jgi:oxaloacetate decarboxylase alpha subunit